MLVKRRCHIFGLLCVLLGFSVNSISPAAQTTPTPTPIISVARTLSADTAFGDGISVGYLLSSPSDSYPSLLGAALGTTTTVRGFAGGQSCDVPKAQVFHTENPGDAANPIYSLLIGSDDVLHGGPEPEYEAGIMKKEPSFSSFSARPEPAVVPRLGFFERFMGKPHEPKAATTEKYTQVKETKPTTRQDDLDIPAYMRKKL